MNQPLIRTFMVLLIVLCAISTSNAQDLTQGLISVWEFDETSGTITNDELDVNDGSNFGATINLSGKIGQCYQFDGTNDYLTIPGSIFNFNPIVDDYSISFWIKSSDPSTTSNAPYLLSQWGGAGGTPFPFVIYILPSASNRLDFNIKDGSTMVTVSIPGASLWNNSWHNVVFLVNNKVAKAYLDGQFVTSVSIPFSSYSATSYTTTYLSTTPNGYDRFVSMYFDQLGIWDKALTPAEISDLYNSDIGLANADWGYDATDTESPTISSCPTDETFVTGTALPDYLTQVTVSDNISTVGNMTITQNPLAGTIITNSTPVSITATDEAGNNTNCSFTVNISQISSGSCLWVDNSNYISHTLSNVAVGNDNSNRNLHVFGNIFSKEVTVQLSVPAPDYVFEQNYQLMELPELQQYLDKNKHLPEIPSAKEMEKNGVDLSEMNMLLLKKVEELTLYILEQQKEMNALKKQVNNK